MGYQRALDEIFASYLRAKDGLLGKYDREVRTPEVVVDLARRLDLLPPRDRLVRVTGSKGKGSVTRLVAALLGEARPGEPVGCVTSPEEIEHTDRMRVDGEPIPEADFVRIWSGLRGRLDLAERELPPGRYLSPSGLMLLVALSWFRERGVVHFVIEGGRGVRWDEVGRMPSKVGVVTSVFLEHAEYIGPDIADVAADKLSLLETTDVAVVGHLARRFLAEGARVVTPGASRAVAGPRWLAEDAAMAAAAASAYLGRAVAVPARLPNLPSFGREGALVYEGLIARVSFDRDFWAADLGSARDPLVLLSLPDDKDVAGVDEAFRDLGVEPLHLVLTGERGRLSFAAAEALGRVAGRLRFDDAEGFADLLGRLSAGRDRVVLAGTQTFLRLVKRAIRPRHG